MLNDAFDQWVLEHSGNKYVALRELMIEARSLIEKYDNILLPSEALSWILTGVRPDILNKHKDILQHRKYSNYVDAVDFLSWIDDIDVRTSAYQSIVASRKSRHLIYLYNTSLDEYKRARVRILVRMMWFQ